MKISESSYHPLGWSYNTVRRADPYLTGRLIDHLYPEKKEFHLDIGCGTGNYTIAMNDRGSKFYGVDPSDKLLQEARFRSQKINWIQGLSQSIPVENKFFSGATAMMTIHQWLDFPASFLEINRVLKMKSRFVIFTALPEQMETYWLHHYFPGMMQRSIKQMPTLNLIRQAVRHTGFRLIHSETYSVQDSIQDLLLYSGKNHPALYLDEQVRNEMSSFKNLSDPSEIKDGLKNLAMDLANGKFQAIKRQHDDAAGDYIFLVLQKIG